MSRLNFTRLLVAFVVLLGVAHLSAEEERILGRGPIVITSESLVADQKEGRAVFEGSVEARSEDMTLVSERMTVFYTEDGGVERIEAEGQVKLTHEERVVVSEEALFVMAERKITFTGNPKAMEGPNVVTGTKMIYLMDEGLFMVEESRVILEQSEPPEGSR
jgi:lipopolysaccharide export system protein LptA